MIKGRVGGAERRRNNNNDKLWSYSLRINGNDLEYGDE